MTNLSFQDPRTTSRCEGLEQVADECQPTLNAGLKLMKRNSKTVNEIPDPPNAGTRRGSDQSSATVSEHPPQRIEESCPTSMPVRRGPVPVAIRTLALQMMAEGASPQQIVEATRAKGFARVTEATVKHWFSRHPKLRERALRRQIEAIKMFSKNLEEGGEEGKARLAEAARFAGLAQSAHPRSRLDLPKLVGLHNSMWESLQRENVTLKHRALQLEAQRVSISRRIEAAKLRVDRMRWQAVQQQLDQLWEAVSASAASGRLTQTLADTLRSLYRTAGRRLETKDRKPGAARGKAAVSAPADPSQEALR